MSSRIREQRSPESGTTTIANTEFDAYEVGGDKIVTAQVNYTGLDASDGSFIVQFSNDNENWDDVDLTVVLPSGDGSETIQVNHAGSRYARVKLSQGSNTTGEFFVVYVSK